MVSAPSFRKGKQRRVDRYTLRYVHTDVDYANHAWKNLSRHDEPFVEYRNKIAAVMGVGLNISARHRRLFHMAGLITDIPGHWSNEELDEAYTPRFDGDNLEDDPEGYAEWSDPEDFNTPARVKILNSDPRAFRRWWEEITRGDDLGLWVATRYIAAGSPPEDDDCAPRFARWGRVPACVGLEGQRREAIAWATDRTVEEVCHERGCVSTYIYYWEGRNGSGDTLSGDHCDSPPPLVLLAPGTDSRRRALDASEASTASRCPSIATGTFGATDLARAMGFSRETAHRRLRAWEEMGLVEKLAYRSYQWTDTVG